MPFKLSCETGSTLLSVKLLKATVSESMQALSAGVINTITLSGQSMGSALVRRQWASAARLEAWCKVKRDQYLAYFPARNAGTYAQPKS